MNRRVKLVTSVHLNFEHVLFTHLGWLAGDSHTAQRCEWRSRKQTVRVVFWELFFRERIGCCWYALDTSIFVPFLKYPYCLAHSHTRTRTAKSHFREKERRR